jgi:hypothetical protein
VTELLHRHGITPLDAATYDAICFSSSMYNSYLVYRILNEPSISSDLVAASMLLFLNTGDSAES